eukprot:s1640_g13.t2
MVTGPSPMMGRIALLLALIHSAESVRVAGDCKGTKVPNSAEACSQIKDEKICSESYITEGKYSVQCAFNGAQRYGLGWSGGGLLQGATYYRLSYHKSNYKGVTLTLNGVQDATVILCSETGGRDCGYPTSLPNDGFKGEGNLLNWMYGKKPEKMVCYSKKIETATATIPAISTHQCVQALIIKCA